MIIFKKTDISKLKQIDRIEYLLKKSILEHSAPSFSFIFFLVISFVLVLFFVIVIGLLLNLNFGEEVYINFIEGVESLPHGI